MYIFSPIAHLPEFIYRFSRIIHSLKLGLALCIAIGINFIWPLPHFIWSLVTIVIIMMHLPQVGQTMEKSLQRAIGTILGAVYGVLLIVYFSDVRIIMLLMILAIMLLSYLASGRFLYVYLVAGFTIIIVVGDNSHDTFGAVWRTLNILLGCVIAVSVSLLVLPITAKYDWRHQLSNSLHLMSKILVEQLVLDIVSEQQCQREIREINLCIKSQRNLFFSLSWESLTLHNQHLLLTQLADNQNRMVTLLVLLSQTRLDESGRILYTHWAPHINQIATRLVAQLHELNKYVRGSIAEFQLYPTYCVDDIQSLMIELTSGIDPTDFESYSYCLYIYQIANVTQSIHSQIVVLSQSGLSKPRFCRK